MKINSKTIISLLLVLFALVSISAVSAESISDNALSTTYHIENDANATYIQQVVDGAAAGDTISFAKNGNYTFAENVTINVGKTLNFEGNGSTFNIRNGFNVKATTTSTIDGTTFNGFNFVISNVTVGTQEPWNGRPIYLNGGANIKITNCNFTYGAAGVYIQACTNVSVLNCNFYGIANTSTISVGKEVGDKAVSVMGSNGVTIRNSRFTGELLDAISIASNSKNIVVEGNYIEDAWYGIFYGGGIENVTTVNNVFNKTKIYAIGLVKAAQTTNITNNTFILGEIPKDVASGKLTSAAAVYLEQGNTAHGEATRIGNINIKNNIFEIAPGTEDEIGSRYAVELASQGGQLKPNGPITISGNTYAAGIDKFIFIDKTWDYDNGTVSIPAFSMDSQFTIDGTNMTLNANEMGLIQLTGQDSTVLPKQDVTLKFTKGTETITKVYTTDSMGLIKLENFLAAGNWTVIAEYAGATYSGTIYSSSSIVFNLESVPVNYELYANNVTKYYKNATQYTVKVTDQNDKAVGGAEVDVYLSGSSFKNLHYTIISNMEGVATLPINLAPGEYTIRATFGNYTINNKITVLAITYKLETKDIVKYYKNDTKYTVTVKDQNGNVIVGETVAISISSSSWKSPANYNIVTDENGTATLAIGLAAGSYTITAKVGTTSAKNSITVKPILTAPSITKKVTQPASLKAKLVDGQGNPVGAGHAILFTVKNKQYYVNTNSEGIASLAINLAVGTWSIQVQDLASGSKVTATVKVTK